jgi:hypothetical protein
LKESDGQRRQKHKHADDERYHDAQHQKPQVIFAAAGGEIAERGLACFQEVPHVPHRAGLKEDGQENKDHAEHDERRRGRRVGVRGLRRSRKNVHQRESEPENEQKEYQRHAFLGRAEPFFNRLAYSHKMLSPFMTLA